MKTRNGIVGLATGALLGVALHGAAQNSKMNPQKAPMSTSKTQRAAPSQVSHSARLLTTATQSFLAALTTEQRARTAFEFASDERRNWNYVPMNRRGIAWRDLNAGQKQSALQVLRVALSVEGVQKIENIRALEPILYALENNNPGRDVEAYTFTVFGAPDAKDAWALRYEGHHISLHWTILDGRVIADSPQFLGANPARVPDDARFGAKRGTRALSQEEDLGRGLIVSMDAVQRQTAILSVTAPPEILTTNKRRVAIEKNEGVSYGNLNSQQREKLIELIEEHARSQPRALAKKRLQRLKKAGLDEIKFAWMGSLKAGEGHYYRVQGPTFLIEYDNTQNGANHVHTVWRDFENDFGEDVLEKHFTDTHSHHAH